MVSSKGVVQVSCGVNHTLALVKGTHLHASQWQNTFNELCCSTRNQNVSVHGRVVVGVVVAAEEGPHGLKHFGSMPIICYAA